MRARVERPPNHENRYFSFLSFSCFLFVVFFEVFVFLKNNVIFNFFDLFDDLCV